MPEALASQRAALRERLAGYARLLVAYSGGVDSAYLAWEAYQVLGDRMTAVLADSPSLPRTHLAAAVAFAEQHGIPLRILRTAEMDRAEYIRNDSARCFHCKDELFTEMERLRVEISSEHGSEIVLAYGRNLDDDGDFRPGQHAAARHHAAAPLAEAGLGKQAIRQLAQAAGLSVWDKPASACLSSRIEHGRPVTLEALHAVEQAEEALHALGFSQLRVRHHGELARVEIERSELPRALSVEMLGRITEAVRSAGFRFVTLDTEGYRSGSMNVRSPQAFVPVQAILEASRAS
ncbi:MAG TPA: ATP-dependent sacrificial sulfur transferase LarE [Granulicella sp.]